MRKTYKNAVMWALYGVLFLFMTVFQTVTFGRMRLVGVKLSLIPVTAACIAMHGGGESGAIFGLMGALVWLVIRNRGGYGWIYGRRVYLMVGLSLYYGFTSTGVDNYAHVGGLIGGFLLAICLYRKRGKEKIIREEKR